MTDEEAFAIPRAEIVPPGPVQARWAFGRRKPGDIIWTTWTHPLLVSDRVVTLLHDAGFTGWGTYAVNLVGRDGEPIPGYHGLSIHGRCGPIDDSKSVQVLKRFPARIRPVWMGYYFDPDTWDGSDLFMPGDWGSKFVVEDVKRAFDKAKIKTDVDFTSLPEVERTLL